MRGRTCTAPQPPRGAPDLCLPGTEPPLHGHLLRLRQACPICWPRVWALQSQGGPGGRPPDSGGTDAQTVALLGPGRRPSRGAARCLWSPPPPADLAAVPRAALQEPQAWPPASEALGGAGPEHPWGRSLGVRGQSIPGEGPWGHGDLGQPPAPVARTQSDTCLAPNLQET